MNVMISVCLVPHKKMTAVQNQGRIVKLGALCLEEAEQWLRANGFEKVNETYWQRVRPTKFRYERNGCTFEAESHTCVAELDRIYSAEELELTDATQ